MNLLDHFWNVAQDERLDELSQRLHQARMDRNSAEWDLRKLLVEENLELKVRLGMLVRLLITKGVITAEEYAALVSKAHAQPGRPEPVAAPDRPRDERFST